MSGMPLHDYQQSTGLAHGLVPTDEGPPTFAALIMAALRVADSSNADRIRVAFPDIASELEHRYWSPGGRLPHEACYVQMGGGVHCALPPNHEGEHTGGVWE